MKHSAITRIVIYSIVTVLLSGLLLVGLTMDNFIPSWISEPTPDPVGSNKVKYSDGKVDASGIDSLEIYWINGSVTVKTADIDDITFVESGFDSGDSMVWSTADRTLCIRYAKGMESLSFCFSTHIPKDLVVTLPEDWEGNTLYINSTSAKIDIANLSVYDLTVVNTSGNCQIRNSSATDITFNTVSGDINYEGFVSKVYCTTTSGNCFISTTSSPALIELESVSGDLELTLPESAGFTASIASVSGAISSDFLTTTVKGVYTYGDKQSMITAETVSGNVYIKKG